MMCSISRITHGCTCKMRKITLIWHYMSVRVRRRGRVEKQLFGKTKRKKKKTKHITAQTAIMSATKRAKGKWPSAYGFPCKWDALHLNVPFCSVFLLRIHLHNEQLLFDFVGITWLIWFETHDERKLTCKWQFDEKKFSRWNWLKSEDTFSQLVMCAHFAKRKVNNFACLFT